MRYLITGGAGFVGSNLCDALLSARHEVTVLDDISTGFEAFLKSARLSASFNLVRGDLLDPSAVGAAMRGVDFVFHLGANADVRSGLENPHRDLEQNTLATFNVLEAMRCSGVREIAFASTGSIYGEPEIFPTPEHAPFPIQTSLYGASKLACEGLIQAYCEGYGFRGWIFRFVSILGPRYSHGHVFDFIRKLRDNPRELEVLGDGRQRKSYLDVSDCIDAMLVAVSQARGKVNIFNLGTDEYISVNDSLYLITEALGVQPFVYYTGGSRGWIGDSPFIFLDCTKISALGWRPKVTIREGVLRTVDWIQKNAWVLEERR